MHLCKFIYRRENLKIWLCCHNNFPNSEPEVNIHAFKLEEGRSRSNNSYHFTKNEKILHETNKYRYVASLDTINEDEFAVKLSY